MTSSLTHLLWSCVLGTATVVVVGLLGRAVGNERVGIVAAIVAAIYPNMWIPDGSLGGGDRSDLLHGADAAAGVPVLAATELGASRRGRRGVRRRRAVPIRAHPARPVRRPAARAAHRGPSACVSSCRWLGVSVVATLIVIGPWVGYNLSRFKHPVYLSSQADALLASANCNTTYYGSLIGFFSIPCATAYQHEYHVTGDQSEQAIGYRRAAVDYISHHKGRVPIVVLARLGRILDVYRPSQDLSLLEFFGPVEKSVGAAALFSYYALALLVDRGRGDLAMPPRDRLPAGRHDRRGPLHGGRHVCESPVPSPRRGRPRRAGGGGDRRADLVVGRAGRRAGRDAKPAPRIGRHRAGSGRRAAGIVTTTTATGRGSPV